MTGVVLSLFPGIGLLDRAFEEEGFCVVRGPDLLWGGDVRRFSPPAGAFWGVMGGSPCQDFSSLRREAPTGYGREMLAEFARVVSEARPAWWLLENVARVPNVKIAGYSRQRIDANQGWYSGVSRLRHFQYGTTGLTPAIQIPRGRPVRGAEPAALACDGRSFREVCRLQGLPDDFDLPGFLECEKVRAVGNGVPLVLGRVVARAILIAHGLAPRDGEWPTFDGDCERRRCACGCGRVVMGRASFDGPTCRKRAERARKRDATACVVVTTQQVRRCDLAG